MLNLFLNLSTILKMAYTNEELRSMLYDVVTVLDLSDEVYSKHGPLGTPPATLVRLVLEEKDRQIRMLKMGMAQIEDTRTERDPCELAQDYQDMTYGADAPSEYDPS